MSENFPPWAGTKDDRSLQVGRLVWYSLGGPAWHIAERLAQIIADNPGMDVSGTCVVYVMPPQTEEERQAEFNARAEAAWEDDHR